MYPLAVRYLPPAQPYQFATKSPSEALVIHPASAFDRVRPVGLSSPQCPPDTDGKGIGSPQQAAEPNGVVKVGKQGVNRKKSKKPKRPPTPFPVILRRMINESDPSLISWTPCGTGFVIESKDPRISSAISPYFARKFAGFPFHLLTVIFSQMDATSRFVAR